MHAHNENQFLLASLPHVSMNKDLSSTQEYIHLNFQFSLSIHEQGRSSTECIPWVLGRGQSSCVQAMTASAQIYMHAMKRTVILVSVSKDCFRIDVCTLKRPFFLSCP